jgi:hypothetical protein
VERGIMVHELKTWPEFFNDIVNGNKPFEVRKDDRGYRAGDILRLREFDPCKEEYSGREAYRRITYRVPKDPAGSPVPPVDGLLQPGVAVLGIERLSDPRDGIHDSRNDAGMGRVHSRCNVYSARLHPRHRPTDDDWHRLADAARLIFHDQKPFIDEVNTVIFEAEDALRKALAADLRSLGTGHPGLASWAETLARRYERCEEGT